MDNENVKNTREGNGIVVVDKNTTRDELSKIHRGLLTEIRNMSRTRSNTTEYVGRAEIIARNILDIYEESEDKDILHEILDKIANYMINSKKGNDLKNLADIRKKLNTNKIKLLYDIHSITLFEGRKEIPLNFSQEYLTEIINSRRMRNKLSEDSIIYDDEVVKFIEGLGHDFRIKNPKEYLDIVEAVVYNPLNNNKELAKDPKINQNKMLLDILVDYGRTFRDVHPEEEYDMDIAQIIGTISTVFNDLISNLPESYFNVLNERLNRYGNFNFVKIQKDITEYTSFEEFINEMNLTQVNPASPLGHTPIPRFIFNHRTDPEGMSDNDKFRAIQELIKNLRKEAPGLTINTVLIGYEEPFKGYVVFPFERQKTADKMLDTNEKNDGIYKVVVSDSFGSAKSGGFRALTRVKMPEVFGSDQNKDPNVVNGSATRVDTYNVPGIIAVAHIIKDNSIRYYTEMITEVTEELANNPNATYSNAIRTKPSEMGVSKHKVSKTKSKNVNPTIQFTNVNGRNVDQFGYDDLGINIEEVKKTSFYSSTDMKRQAKDRQKLAVDMVKKYGNGKTPAHRLLDHCLKQMVFEGKNLVKVAKDFVSKDEYKDIVGDLEGLSKETKDNMIDAATSRMYVYIRNMMSVVMELEPTYVNDSLKEMYEKDILTLEETSQSQDIVIAEKRSRREELKANLKDTLTYFNR